MYPLHFSGHVFAEKFFIDMMIKKKRNWNMSFELDLLFLLVSIIHPTRSKEHSANISILVAFAALIPNLGLVISLGKYF